MGERYVVVATHNTGHGEVSNPVMITSDIEMAINTARSVEKLDFQFYDNEVGVTVYRMTEDIIYGKNDFSWFSGNLPPRTMVFSRMHGNRCSKSGVGCRWTEEWFDSLLQQKVDGRVSVRGRK